jgi:hypothetical protein
MKTRRKTLAPVGHLFIDLDFYYKKLVENPVTGCIIWTGARHRQGYGMIGGYCQGNTKRIMTVVHRVAWMLHSGQPLKRKDNVIHTCTTNNCCNPAHLFVGSAADKVNMMDLHGNRILPNPDRKQRRKYKYTDEELLWLRVATIDEIMKRFGVKHRWRASNIRWAAKKHYKWLKDEQAKEEQT